MKEQDIFKRFTDAERAALEEEGWNVTVFENGSVELENWSPLGEDLLIYVDCDECLEVAIEREIDCFDVDDHVEPLIYMRGKKGVPESIRALVEDAEDIEDMLRDLLQTLYQKEYERSNKK